MDLQNILLKEIIRDWSNNHIPVYFGANNDTQILLNNQTGKKLVNKYCPEEYERLKCNLIVAKMACLEPGRSDDMLEEYLTGYACKGGDSSANFEEAMKVITNKYCAHKNNADKSLRSFFGKQMIEIVSGTSVTRDQCQYMLGGGPMKRNTCESTMKCLLTSMSLEEFQAS